MFGNDHHVRGTYPENPTFSAQKQIRSLNWEMRPVYRLLILCTYTMARDERVAALAAATAELSWVWNAEGFGAMHEAACDITLDAGGLQLGVAFFVHMCACTGSLIYFKVLALNLTCGI